MKHLIFLVNFKRVKNRKVYNQNIIYKVQKLVLYAIPNNLLMKDKIIIA